MAFAIASAAIVGATYLFVSLGPRVEPAQPAAPGTARQDSVSRPEPATGSGSAPLLAALDHEIELWSASLAANQGDFIAATRLGGLHLQRARVTGDLGDYERALAAADRAVEADPIYWAGHTLRASVLFALHEFAAARDEARATFAADPTQLDALAVLGDASLELGDVSAAEAAFTQLAEASPTPPVWSRIGHLAFLRGDVEGALAAVERCVAAVDPDEDPAGAAFYQFQLGELHRALGNDAAAAAAYRGALGHLDGYVPALAGLAHVRAAQGERDEAIELLEAATMADPMPELVAALGDLYALSGEAAKAEAQYDLVERIGEIGRASGGVYDRQLIIFAADHGRDLARAVAAAEAALQTRRDAYGYDAYAWALLAAGRVDEASAAIAQALALGTPDPRIAYHAGMISLAAGDRGEARGWLESAVAGSSALAPLQAERAAASLAALATGPTQP